MSRALGSSTREVKGPPPSPVSTPPADHDEVLQWVENLLTGVDQEKSFQKLHRRFFPSIRSFFQRRGFSLEESNDLTQDVFLRVFKGIASFRRESRFERWLFEIAANVWRNELRRMGAEKRDGYEQSLDAAVEGDDPSGRSAIEPVDPNPGVLDVIQARERHEGLSAALRELPPQMRHVCELRYVQQRKYQEIADVLKISIETVKAHLHQARKRLMTQLGSGQDRNRD
jgi:RNA polymerase sigma-70 factor (ECF subfamily)